MRLVKLLYFAWIRERIGLSEEVVHLPKELLNVEDLIDWLALRGENYQYALSDRACVCVAINQLHVDRSATLLDAHEIALFPPVTGG